MIVSVQHLKAEQQGFYFCQYGWITLTMGEKTVTESCFVAVIEIVKIFQKVFFKVQEYVKLNGESEKKCLKNMGLLLHYRLGS
jgi:hypothetical protein